MIKVTNLTKIYNKGTRRELMALDNVTLQVNKGEILALLGPNGAGKTTLINTICGLVEPTKGSVTVRGYDIKKDYRDSRQLIGLVPQEIFLEHFATVIDVLRYTRGYFGKKQDEELYKEILSKLSILNKKDEKIFKLSGGMKRRVLLARALVSEPEVLFLDEPTAGVDVELRRELISLVKDLNKEGMTIILTTHYLEEAERLSDRVALINKGKLEFIKEKESLVAEHKGKSLEDIYVNLVKDKNE